MKSTYKVFILVSVLLLTAACTTTAPEEIEDVVAYPEPSGELILGSSLDDCGRVNSEPYPLEEYFENHPFNQDIYDYYVYREDEYLDSNYWYGTTMDIVASLKLPSDLDPGDEVKIEWIHQSFNMIESDEELDLEPDDKVLKTHTTLSPLPCKDGNTYISDEFYLSEVVLDGPFPDFRVEFTYNGNLEYSESFSLDGVQ